MKYIFIINPNSGSKKNKETLLANIHTNKHHLDYDVYITKGKNDATHYVDQYCQSHKEDVVFCACGGDGTINEVVSGMINHPQAILACYPCGSGNDFVKVYGGKEYFLKTDYLTTAKETTIDIMQINDKYSLNVVNYGFEVTVCDTANKVRRNKIIGGKNSYTSGIFVALMKSMKNYCQIYINDKLLYDGNILLSTFANGKYVGGKYCCAPYSNNEDGLLEITLVKPISIFRFLTLVKAYQKGKHLENPKYKNFIQHTRSNNVTIVTKKVSKICLDGEIYKGNHFKIINHQKKIRFLKP